MQRGRFRLGFRFFFENYPSHPNGLASRKEERPTVFLFTNDPNHSDELACCTEDDNELFKKLSFPFKFSSLKHENTTLLLI